MSRNMNLAKLLPVKNALKRKTENIPASAAKSPEVVSPYFSPVKTRNQRKHIKIQTEETLSKQPISKLAVNTTTVKQECVETSTLKPKRKVKLVAQSIQNEITAAVIKQEKIDEIEEAIAATVKPKRKVKAEVRAAKAEIADEETLKMEGDSVKVKDENQPAADWEPENWKQIIQNIREMRKSRLAPVDTMGCHKCSDGNASEKTQRFHHLIALMLSSQTKDTVTFEAMKRLKQHGLTPQTMSAIDAGELEKLLVPVSFYKRKAIYIKKTADILIANYDSDIPNSVDEMVKLPGVGPKMAHICMRVAWDIVSGIGVDTHVHRISNRLKWMPKATKEPEQTRVALEKWLPKDLWSEVNELLVGFGQTICTPTYPKCSECMNYDLCPSKISKKK